MSIDDLPNSDNVIAIGIAAFVLLLMLVPYCLYLYNLQKFMEEISPENRTINPQYVWLLLIPLFGTVYHFIVVEKVSQAIKLEFESRKITLHDPKAGYNMGLAMCILSAVSVLPLCCGLTSLGWLVCWIIYWVQLNEFRKQLNAHNAIL
jgi:hypothetical protein